MGNKIITECAFLGLQFAFGWRSFVENVRKPCRKLQSWPVGCQAVSRLYFSEEATFTTTSTLRR